MTDFRKIYEEQASKVYRYLLCLTGSKQTAEELLAETFYQAMLHIGRYRGDSSILTWLCGIAGNLWKNELRRAGRFTGTPPELLPLKADAVSPEDTMIQSDEARRIRLAADGLPDHMRTVFLLRVLGDLSFREIAGILGKTESWARVTYYRARVKITEEVLK